MAAASPVNQYSRQITQENAAEPPSAELKLTPPHLSRCDLERPNIAEKGSGNPKEQHEVIIERESGRTWLFERKIMDAIYGEVWRAVEVTILGDEYHHQYDQENRTRWVAVKRMQKETLEKHMGQFAENPFNEIAALGRISDPGHPQVLRKEVALEDDDTVYLLTKYVDGGEMFNIFLEDGAFTKARTKLVRGLFRQLMEGLKYTHSKGICHADMSLENVLVDRTRTKAYIIDYGMSLLMPIDEEYRRLQSLPDGRKAKSSYCSPETFKEKAYDGVKVDVFATGSMLFMMLTGAYPFAIASRLDRKFKLLVVKGNVKETIGPNRLELMPRGNQAAELLGGMMAYDPKKRLLPDQVLHHAWFAH